MHVNQADIKVLHEYTKCDLLHLCVIAVTEPRMWLEMSSKAAIPLQLNVGQENVNLWSRPYSDHPCCALYGLYCQISFVFLSI